jgi:hypothetical protein
MSDPLVAQCTARSRRTGERPGLLGQRHHRRQARARHQVLVIEQRAEVLIHAIQEGTDGEAT